MPEGPKPPPDWNGHMSGSEPPAPPQVRYVPDGGGAPTGAAGLAIGVLWVCVCLGLLLSLDRQRPEGDAITISYRCPPAEAQFCRDMANHIAARVRERGGKVEER